MARCVAWSTAHARAVAGAILLAAVLLLPWTATHLSVDSDTLKLLPEGTPFRQRYEEFSRLFPSASEALFVLVEGSDPWRTRDAAQALADRLDQDRAHFHDVYLAGSGPFFERAGLLYRSVEELEEFADGLAQVQPLLAALERDPHLDTIAEAIGQGLDRQPDDPAEQAAFFDQLNETVSGIMDGTPASSSWADLLVRGSAFEPPRAQVLMVEPVLAFDSAFPAEVPLAAVREAFRALGAGPDVTVRITGNPALNDEEMRGMVNDVGLSSLVSFVLVVALLQYGLRSLRLALAGGITLLAGLVFTATFAAAVVGGLNLLSVSFAVLFIGLAIDFAIHLLVHAEASRTAQPTTPAALAAGMRRIGSSLVLCAITTSLGFFAFAPTKYQGVAELGLIAGAGMLVILVLTPTLLPALVTLLAPGTLRAPWRPGPSRPRPHPRLVVAAFALLGTASLAAVPLLRFDADVVRLRNPETESVQAFEHLLAEAGRRSPWKAAVMALDEAAADALAARLRALPEVEHAITVSDLVPDDQDRKLAILADAALLVAPVPLPKGAPPDPTTQQQLAALRELADGLARAESGAPEPLGDSMRSLRESLERFVARDGRDAGGGDGVAALETLLFGEYERQMARLRGALETERVTRESLPPELVHRMLASDGRALVEISPRGHLGDAEALERFVDSVLAVVPDATGSAVNLVEFARAVVLAFEEALTGAFLTISLLVLVLWRRLGDTLCVIATLLLGALLTSGAVGLLGMSFNFANVLVLPLLLGVGVDSAIHVVHRWREGEEPGGGATARAILFSALTTGVSFGGLALSSHRGMASLGQLLVVSLAIFLACSLVFLPALLSVRAAPSPAGENQP